MIRETVSIEQIRNLNKLSWHRKHYANFKFADGSIGLEINYYFNNDCYMYKVICDNWNELHKLRAELDDTTELVELHDGRLVSCSKR